MTTWAYDIETEDWDKLVVAIAVSARGEIRVMRTDEETAEWYYSLPASDLVVSHNGGGFDFLQLISACRKGTWVARMAGSAIVSCRIEGHALCQDSFRLFMTRLDDWTGLKERLDLPCRCGDDCGGYCSIRRDMPIEEYRRVEGYCLADCKALLTRWLEDVPRLASEGLAVYSRGNVVRGTLGAVAWHSAVARCALDTERPSPDLYETGRTAYFGGRTEVGRTRAQHAARYDVNAAYPWALTLPVPHGTPRDVIGSAARAAYRCGQAGIFWAKVQCPMSDVPLLPHRCTESYGPLQPDRVLWATGTIDGAWTTVELEKAESHGAVILNIDRATIWDNFDALYRPYVEHIYARRVVAKQSGDERWARILKWYANALSGKLAQRGGQSKLVVLGEDDNPPDGGFRVGRGHRIWAVPEEWRVPVNARTWHAAYLTSRARGLLLDRLMRHSGRWVYTDTDSVYSLEPDETDVHHERLGAWKDEGELTDWECLAPKLYRFNEDSGKTVVKARGIRRAGPSDFEDLKAGREVHKSAGVLRLRSSDGNFVRREIVRSHKASLEWAGTRRVREDGITVPVHRDKDGGYSWPI